MLKPRRKPISLLLSLLTAFSLAACAKVPIEDDPAEQAKATAVAEKYLKAFAAGDGPLVLEMSEAPFWGDGELLPDATALQDALTEQLQGISELKFTLQNARFVSMTELKTLLPALHDQLTQAGFSGDVHAVALDISVEGETSQGLVLVRRMPDGIWKVVGIGDSDDGNSLPGK